MLSQIAGNSCIRVLNFDTKFHNVACPGPHLDRWSKRVHLFIKNFDLLKLLTDIVWLVSCLEDCLEKRFLKRTLETFEKGF